MEAGKLLSGSDMKDIRLYKILRTDLTHHGYTYKEGWNELPKDEKFNPSGDCQPGGFYITNRPEDWIAIGEKMAEVTLPADAMIWTGKSYSYKSNAYKVNKLILGSIMPIPYAIYLAAVKKDGLKLVHHVPKEHYTEEIFLAAVQQDGIALYYVPLDSRSYDVCFAAAQQRSQALLVIPGKHRTTALYRGAIKSNGMALYHIPTHDRTYELCLLAVQQCGNAINQVPEEYMTPELCLAAVQQNGLALYRIPQNRRTIIVCNAAISQNLEAAGAVLFDYLTGVLQA